MLFIVWKVLYKCYILVKSYIVLKITRFIWFSYEYEIKGKLKLRETNKNNHKSWSELIFQDREGAFCIVKQIWYGREIKLIDVLLSYNRKFVL